MSASAILGDFNPGRIRFDSLSESGNRTQLVAEVGTYRDSDDPGMIPMEGGSICVGIGINHEAGIGLPESLPTHGIWIIKLACRLHW